MPIVKKIKFTKLVRDISLSAIFVLAAGFAFILAKPVWAQDAFSAFGAASITGIGDIVRIIVGGIVFMYVHFLGLLLLVVINILVQIASYNDFVNSAVVINGWSIVRDISNMFFIIILLYIAFATILGVGGIDWKQRLPKLLIFAVLINFTRVISGLAIDFGQVVMITFVNGFKDAAGGNFAELLGIRQLLEISVPGSLQQAQLVASGDVGGAALDFIQVISGMIGAALFATVAFIVILLITMVLVYRMVMLWVYVTLSPLAFILGAFPQGEKYYSQWWSQFVSTIAIGPVLAFFLWLSLLSVGSITANIGTTSIAELQTGTTAAAQVSCGANQICQPDNVLKFIVGIGMLMGGLTIAQSIAGSAGEGMGGLVGFAKKASTGAIKRFTGVSTVQKARDAFSKKDMQAGGIGGALAKAGVYMQAGLGGVKGQKAVKDYQSTKIKEQKDRMSSFRDQDLIQQSRGSGSSYERAAAMSILGERGAINEKNGFTRTDIESARAQFGNDTAGYAQFMQATKKSAPSLAYDLKNPSERAQFVSDARRGVARVDNLEKEHFQGAEGQEFVRGLTEGQTTEQIKGFYNKLTDDAADEFEAQMKGLIANGQSTPEVRQAFADMTNDIDTAFPETMPTANQEIERWVRRTSTSMLDNRKSALAKAQERINRPPPGAPAGGAPPAPGGQPAPGGAPSGTTGGSFGGGFGLGPPPPPTPGRPPSSGGAPSGAPAGGGTAAASPAPTSRGKNLYSQLGVSSGASFDEIKKSYRKQALKAHPDRGGGEGEMEKVNAMYEVMKDQHARNIYDEYGDDVVKINEELEQDRKDLIKAKEEGDKDMEEVLTKRRAKMKKVREALS